MIYIKIAGIINLITALIHLIAGQMDLVNPLLKSDLTNQEKGEFVGVWHMATILLFFTSILILRFAYSKMKVSNSESLRNIGILYILMGLPFIVMSIYYGLLVPQWILLMPIGILLLVGVNSIQTNE